MQIYPASRSTPPPAPPPPHPTLCTSPSNLQEFPVQWVGPATLLTPKPVPSGFCPDLQTLAAPLPLQIRGRDSGATRGAPGLGVAENQDKSEKSGRKMEVAGVGDSCYLP